MTDIIEQCALASLNDHRKRKGWDAPLADLDIEDGEHWLADIRAGLIAFKAATAEPTDAMMSVSGMFDLVDVTNPENTNAEVRRMFMAMIAKMYEDIGI